MWPQIIKSANTYRPLPANLIGEILPKEQYTVVLLWIESQRSDILLIAEIHLLSHRIKS